MKGLIQAKLGMIGFILGLVGVGFGVGGVENAQTVGEWVTVAGVTVSSLMLMQLSVWMLQDAE